MIEKRTGAPAILMLVTLALGIGLVLAVTGAPGSASDDGEYLGSFSCKKCHLKQYKSWEKTTMAMSFEGLKPNVKPDEKSAAGLDASKDYTTDPTCLKCHTVGYDQPSGYQTPPAGDEAAQKQASRLEGVGCESCHGPGKRYLALHEEIQSKKRKYTSQEMVAAGMTAIGKDVCVTCHSTESPFVGEDYVFDYETKKTEGTHEHFPLKYRTTN